MKKSNRVKQGMRCCVLALASAGLLAAQGGSAQSGPGQTGPAQTGPAQSGAPAQAGLSDQALLLQFENPLAALIKLGFLNVQNFPIYRFNRFQSALILQPSLPLRVSNYWELITLPLIPGLRIPDFSSPTAATLAFGDVSSAFLFTPVRPGKLIWGFGPSFLFPTATIRLPAPLGLGQGKFGLGPTMILLRQWRPKWTVGLLAGNIWSVGGPKDRAPVNQFLLQYFVDYNFGKGWFLNTTPVIRGFWRLGSDSWQVPFGGGIGKIYKIGPQRMVTNVGMYYLPIRPQVLLAGKFPAWQGQVGVTLLFPRAR